MKKATNVSVDAEILAEARRAGIDNMSAFLENALRAHLKATAAARFEAENAEAIKAYNDHVSTGMWYEKE